MPLSLQANERFYEALAAAIDAAGPEQESLFLTKLALLLGNALADEEAVNQAIALAARQLATKAEADGRLTAPPD